MPKRLNLEEEQQKALNWSQGDSELESYSDAYNRLRLEMIEEERELREELHRARLELINQESVQQRELHEVQVLYWQERQRRLDRSSESQKPSDVSK